MDGHNITIVTLVQDGRNGQVLATAYPRSEATNLATSFVIDWFLILTLAALSRNVLAKY